MWRESGVSILRSPHHHSNHVQDVCPLGIDEILVNIPTGFVRTKTESHRDGTDVNWTESPRILFGNELALLLPELKKLFGLRLNGLKVNRGGSVSKSLAHPLVAITAKADCLPPPLVRHFVRSDDFPVHILGMQRPFRAAVSSRESHRSAKRPASASFARSHMQTAA